MLLIKNAEIFDGTRLESFTGCVLLKGDRIQDVLPQEPEGYEGDVLNAQGLVLAPGFIDSHSHNDFFANRPDAHRFFAPLARQGITTLVAGNCGHSAFCYSPDTPYEKDLSGLFPYNPEYKDSASFSDWARLVDKYSPLNVVALAGHGTVRTSVRGLGNHLLQEIELKEMDTLLEKSLEEGAAGISYGLMYDPDMYASQEELRRAARIAKKHDKPITFHMRACSAISTSYPSLFGRPHNLRAIDEAIAIARDTGAKTHLSHIIFVGKRSWKTLDETISLIDGANQEGLDVTFDLYSYDYGASCINVILPSWYQGLPPAQKKKPFTKLKLYAEIFGAKKLLGLSFHDLEITYAGENHLEYIGRRVDELAKEKGKSGLAAYLDVIDETDASASIHMYQYLNPHIIDVLSRHPKVMFMTDAWIKDVGAQNMAVYGSFPRFFRLSREGQAAPLGEMITKMTSIPAARFGIQNRGRIQPGYFADLVLFDKATVAEPNTEGPPKGIKQVFVNGVSVVENGDYQPTLAGRALRI